jgi:CHAD domain-containing protein
VARAREVPGLDCDESFSLAAARVVEARCAEVFAQSDGLFDVDDIEPVHDMRVATRRLRAALEMFRPCFPRRTYKAALKPLKALAAALGERRDRDVSIELLAAFLEEAPAADRGRLEILLARLREEQGRASAELAPFVAVDRLDVLREALADLVEAARR